MILAGVFAIGEILSSGFFILWFAIGAAAAGLVALMGFGPGPQLVVFIVLSGGLFAYSRRFAERWSGPQQKGVGASRFYGKKAYVLEEIDNTKGTGSVRLDREEWRASSVSGVVIPVGGMVEVESVDGTRLIVKMPMEEA